MNSLSAAQPNSVLILISPFDTTVTLTFLSAEVMGERLATLALSPGRTWEGLGVKQLVLNSAWKSFSFPNSQQMKLKSDLSPQSIKIPKEISEKLEKCQKFS